MSEKDFKEETVRPPATVSGIYGSRGRQKAESDFPKIPPAAEGLAMEARSHYYHEFLNTLPELAFELDSEGRFTFVNDTALRFFGFARQDVHGKNVLSFISESGIDAAREVLSRALRGDNPGPAEYTVIGRDGAETPLRCSYTIIENQGRVIGIRGVAVDITEEKRAKEKLLEREAYLETVLSNAPVVLWATDPEGALTYINGKGLAPGLDRDKLIGTSALDLIPGSASSRRNIERALSGEEFTGIVEGEGFTHKVFYSPLIDGRNGEQAGILGVSVDVTEMAKAQRELKTSERLKTMGEAAAKAGHDINNSLAVPLANLEYMRGLDFSAFGPGEAHPVLAELIDESLTALDRCQRLVRDMMSLTRGGRMSKEPVDFESIVGLVVKEARKYSEARGVGMQFRRAASGCTVLADADMLFRAIQNIAKNAIEASPPGGMVEITTSAWKMGDCGAACVTIRDSGPGIPPEAMESIFKPFFTTKGEGTGLGLAIAWNHINDHGGRIRVESEPGKGTAFDVVLPLSGE
jgi:PAS domain S-box-containing protein